MCKLILRLFTNISGLAVNYAKCSFVPINIQDTESVRWILGCQQTEFPLTYLGMPLTLKRLNKEQYRPFIERIEQRLEGWQGRRLSRAGRLVLVNSVLSSLPIYFMASFILPKWVIKRIDKIRRRFLWGKSGNTSYEIPLLNWNAICLPKEWGGMGVPDLELRNISLLLRWWWKLYRDPMGLWAIIGAMLKGKLMVEGGPKLWIKAGFFFWGCLQNLRPLFVWCTYWSIGDGRSVSFWFDHWGGDPIVNGGMPMLTWQNLSLQEAMPLLCEMAPQIYSRLVEQQNEGNDELQWAWSSDGNYSAKSVYKVMISGGKLSWRYSVIWKAKVLPTVKVFAHLLLRKWILSHQMMIQRGLSCEPRCHTCDRCPMETLNHIFFTCEFAKEVWQHLSSLLGYDLMRVGESLTATWEASKVVAKRYGGLSMKEWFPKFICACWNIWKQRNEKIFRNRQMLSQVVDEIALWNKFC